MDMKGEDLNIMENWPINLLFLIKCNKNHVVLLKKSIFSILTSKQCQSKNTSATHKHTEFISYQTFNKTFVIWIKNDFGQEASHFVILLQNFIKLLLLLS